MGGGDDIPMLLATNRANAKSSAEGHQIQQTGEWKRTGRAWQLFRGLRDSK